MRRLSAVAAMEDVPVVTTPEQLQAALDEVVEAGLLPPYRLTLTREDWAREDVKAWARVAGVEVVVVREGLKPKRVL